MPRTRPTFQEDDDPTPPELYDAPRWYACRTRAQAEKAVAGYFERAEIEAYLPLIQRERQWADRRKRVAFPLLPGYVFGRFDLTRLGDVLRAPGVVTVARPSGYPTPVRDEELESVRLLVAGLNEGGVEPEPVSFLEPGDQVVVKDGPFRGMRGVLLEVRGKFRVAVKLPAIRQAMSVEVAKGSVQVIRGA